MLVRDRRKCILRSVTLRRLTILVLLAVLVVLTPLAQASPPDQTWIGGFYDDADYDDVVLLVTGSLQAVPCTAVPALLPISKVIGLVPATPQATPPDPAPLSEAGRAPPPA